MFGKSKAQGAAQQEGAAPAGGNQVVARKISKLEVSSEPVHCPRLVRLAVILDDGERWEFDMQSELQVDRLVRMLLKFKRNCWGRAPRVAADPSLRLAEGTGDASFPAR